MLTSLPKKLAIISEEKMTETPNLSHIRLLISTPCDGNNLDMFYVSSLSQTIGMIRELGGWVNWHTSPGCADLPLARAKLLGKFYRSDATHMLLVDADMGWEANSVLRLLLADREYIGAAGPKKGYPIIFAANNASEDGEIWPTEVEVDTGIIQCTEVGAAFMLMNKSCASKMVEAYKDTLGWDSGENITEYAVYDPMVFTTPKGKRMRWSEDFSFCKRWRALGGKIYLCPEIELKHTGSHTWSAKQSDNFREQDRYKNLVSDGTIKDGDKLNEPSSPFYDPTKPVALPGQTQIIQRDFVSLTPMDENAMKSIQMEKVA